MPVLTTVEMTNYGGALHDLTSIVRADPERMRILALVASLGLPDCWIAAGFLRDAVWDEFHGYDAGQRYGDVDVVWFDRGAPSESVDDSIKISLTDLDPTVRWSVKNQARMHARNGDAPYSSTTDAMCSWVETSAAVAVKLDANGNLHFSTPLGTGDLFGLVVRPGPRFKDEKYHIFLERCRKKRWLERWPLLTLVAA